MQLLILKIIYVIVTLKLSAMINARKKRKRTGNDAQIMLGMRFGMHILYT